MDRAERDSMVRALDGALRRVTRLSNAAKRLERDLLALRAEILAASR